jgi:hypothetical protein
MFYGPTVQWSMWQSEGIQMLRWSFFIRFLLRYKVHIMILKWGDSILIYSKMWILVDVFLYLTYWVCTPYIF